MIALRKYVWYERVYYSQYYNVIREMYTSDKE